MAAPGKNDKLIELAGEIAAAVQSLDGEYATQRQLIQQVDKLRFMLETPVDPIMKQWETACVMSAMNLLVETGAIDKMPAQGSITSKDLAVLVDIDESAIRRAFKIAVMQGIGEETASNTFAHNAKSRAYLRGGAVQIFRLGIEQAQAFFKLPEYFKTHTREDLFDLKKSPFAYAVGLEGLTYYEAISHNPDRFQKFNDTLSQMEASMPILGMFPFASLKEQVEAEPDRPFIVDIGAGRGQSLLAIQKEAPAGFGAKMILQDRQDVIASMKPEDIPGIETMVYDFFTPQPVKNAHLYLLRRITHDFYEPVCIELLKNVASAMDPTSRLIIADMVMPEKTEMGGDLTIYWLDFCMMMLNGKEKSEEEFREITDAAGLEIVKVWFSGVGAQAQLECRLKQG